ncbi:MAG: alkaline phosphatase [Acidobacteria bacterium RIFCSPHIGHO2_02_FULL_67_57]|nr:MAG: alkaline phosphatase [Acidobacteria bacterium RIFCSPHIGHO2_02_FULL_67_57]
MVTRLLVFVSQVIISVISTGGYAGIVLLMAIESACIPLPSEIIMPFSGYLVGQGRFSLWGVAVAGAVGCNLGSIVAYAVGAYGGRPFLERYGRYVLLTRGDLAWADRWFARYGEATVFFSRLLPVIRTFIALPAGIARMDFLRFNLYTFLGSLPWCLGLAWLGLKLGEHWEETIRPVFEKLDLLIGLLLAAALVWFVRAHLRELRSLEK